jgi:hypothetical protein
MSPSLFNVFINDLPDLLNSSDNDPVISEGRIVSCLLFADDLLIVSKSANGLQRALSMFCRK